MDFQNIKHKSGYTLTEKIGEDILISNEITMSFPDSDVSYLKPVSDEFEEEYQDLSINLNDLYNDLLSKVIKIKDKKISLNDAILECANKWGFLCMPNYHDFGSSLMNDEAYNNLINEGKFKSYKGKREYSRWKLLLNSIIPASQSFLSTYLKQTRNIPSIEDYNTCLYQGVDVTYKNLTRTSYEVIPTSLVAAIVIFSKSRKQRVKKETIVICSYSKCNNEIPQNMGVGRGRLTCSDSCKTLKSRENKKKESH